MTREVHVPLSDWVYERLEDLCRRKGTTMTEILRDAIALEKWVDAERDEAAARERREYHD
jgi:predicted DNA-binding protein